jgi:hypothetical protein
MVVCPYQLSATPLDSMHCQLPLLLTPLYHLLLLPLLLLLLLPAVGATWETA